MLTVARLLEELDLEPAAGASAADAPIRWVHITELPDPTPWLSGGELLLTTGIQLKTAAEQRAFVRRLAEHHLAGLGFGTGFGHDKLPKAMVTEAEKLDFPLFEIPYEKPFIAITEKAFGHLVNEQYEMLQRGIAIHRRLEQLVLEQRGLDEVARALATAIAGTVVVLDSRGQQLGYGEFRRALPEQAKESIGAEVLARQTTEPPAAFVPSYELLEGRALALPISTTKPAARAWLVAIRDSGGLGEFERLILQQAVTVVALELMRRRVVRDTERRLAGDVLSEAVSGSLDAGELRARLNVFGIGEQSFVMVFGIADPARSEIALEQALIEAGSSALVATHSGMLCAVVEPDGNDPIELTAKMRELLLIEHGSVRAGVSRIGATEALRRSYHEARVALEATALSNGHAPEVASYRDLGAFQLLLSVQDEQALSLYCESVLGPIQEGEGEYGGELIKSLEAFLEQNGQWEKASRQLYCHRHTLRYRIRRIEQLTGRDLSNARDRIEFWLALQARELVT